MLLTIFWHNATNQVVIYVRDTFSWIRRTDLEIRGLEAVWVEILIESKKVLVGGFYRSPNTDAHYFNHIIESIDRAHNTNISDIIILGDFNYNMLSDNYNKIKEKYKLLRNRIVSEIRISKQDYFDKLDRLLSTETTDMKIFWKTSKQLLKIGKSNHDIPTLEMNNEYAETDIQNADMLNKYFASQMDLDDNNRPIPHIPPTEYTLTSILTHIAYVANG